MGYLDPTGGLRRQAAAQPAVASLTDGSGGVANDALQAVGVVYAQAEVANNLADLAAKVNTILARLRAAGIIAP